MQVHRITLAAALLLALPGIAPAAEDAAAAAPGNPGVTVWSDPCGFFRSQAWGRGITHVATEMLWACEAIAARRASGMALSERLVAVELALERYRHAVVEAGAAAYARGRTGEGGHYYGAADSARIGIAETTGMLAALEAIRDGF